ncbi:MAG: L,D-transpeptidase [Planctomycetota bacterium]
MVRPFVFAICPLLLVACGGEEKSSTSGDVVLLSLDDPVVEEETSSKDSVAAVPTEADLQAHQGEGKPEPASAEPVKLDVDRALALLNDWHRASTDDRFEVERGASTAAAGLRSLGRVWSGEADAYRSSLRTSTEGTFGADFANYADAWAEKGAPGLQSALSRGAVGSIAHLVWTDVLAETALATDDYRTAGNALGTLSSGMLASGYSRERILELQPRIALVGRNSSAFLESQDYVVPSGGSYWAMCRDLRKQGLLVNQGWIADFNHKRNYNLGAGETLKIPQAKLSVAAWRGDRVMILYADGIPIRLFAVSMGREGEPTPLGTFTLDICEKEPVYYPPGGQPVPYGNPDNPLGERWMGFQEDRQYGIHGTNSEDTIGSYESGGCIRMHNAEVIDLFDYLCKGISVTISA